MFAASFDSKMGCLYSVFDAKKQGKPAWVVRTRNWKLWGGENRLSGLLEGVSVSVPREGYRYPSPPLGLEYRYWHSSTDTSCLETVFGTP
ncbi:hypothetical protein GQ457_10G012080 [Hibiscus cannabinus]